MKVLFLDFDGVLNSEQSKIFWQSREDQATWESKMKTFQGSMLDYIAMEFCPIAISNLEHLLRRNEDLKIVVSSSWRSNRTVEGLRDIFKMSSIISERIIDKTDSFSNIRGEEIQRWLDEHPEVDSYVIVDDDERMLESQKENFVNTSTLHGFQYGDYLWAERILGKWSGK